MTSFLLITHIITGFAALTCGAIAIITKKGKGVHVLTGRIYFWSMVLVAISAILLSIINVLPFLFLIAIFSYYLTWSGYKAIHWKNKKLPTFVFWFDIVTTHSVAAFGVMMVLLSVFSWVGVHFSQTISSLKMVLFVFGVGTLTFAGEDLLLFYRNGNNSKFLWMYTHIGRMLGAYIATFTAFLVVNSQYFSSPLIAWLAPTVFGTPLIFYWIKVYRNKLEPNTARLTKT